MYKKLFLSSLLCLFLTACSKQSQPYESFEDAQVALKALNMALVQTGATKGNNIEKGDSLIEPKLFFLLL